MDKSADEITPRECWGIFASLVAVTILFLTVGLVGVLIPLQPIDAYLIICMIGVTLLSLILILSVFIIYDVMVEYLKPRPILEAV